MEPTSKEWSEDDIDEFEEICRPVVEYIQKKWHPHTRVIIDWDRASIYEERLGIPFHFGD